MEVGIRELKKHLSAYLDRAARGEVIVVTDRGTPKATLGPVLGRLRLEEGWSEGWIRRGEAVPPSPVRRSPAKRTISDVVAEDRGE